MLSAYTYRLPFKQAFKSSGNTFTHRDGIILVYNDGEIEAFGEVAPLPGFSTETFKQVQEVLELNKEYLQTSIGLGNGNEALRLLEQIHKFPSLSFGIDTLLHDLEAKRNDQPLVRFLFKDYSDPVLCNATLTLQDERSSVSKARTLVAEGYTTLKIKVGDHFDKEYRILSQIRNEFRELKLRIDANQAWTTEQAIEHLHALSILNIEYCEQPVSIDNKAGLKAVKEATKIPIAADESVRNKSSAHELSVNKSVDLLVLKPMLLGTFENIFVTNEIATTHNIETVFTTSLESAIGRAAVTAISAGLKSANRAQGLGTGILFQHDLSMDSWLNAAKINFRNSPGLGISLNLDGLKKLF